MLDSLLPNVAWVAGGVAVTLLTTRSRRKKQPKDAKDFDTIPYQLPDSPTSERGEQTIRWLNEQVTPGRDSTDDYRIKASRGAAEALAAQPQRLLPAGTLVCFYDASGSLLVSKRGENRQLEPVAPGIYKDTGSVSFLPTSAIFVVVRDGMLTGFKVYSGDDHLLQAVKPHEEPHRVKRSRFGDSEKWHLTSEGFANCKWSKALGYEVKELRCVLVEDMRRYERRHVKDKGAMEEQIQYHVSREQYLGDEISTLQSNLSQQEKENETKRQRLHDLQQTCYRLRVDNEQKTAVIAQLENRLADANMRIQAAEQAMDVEARLSVEYKSTSDRLAERAAQDKAYFTRKLAEEKERMQKQEQKMSKMFLEKETLMRQSIEEAQLNLATHQQLLSAVTEERNRLDAALQSISGQMEVISGANSRRASDLDFDADKLRELRVMLEEVQKPRRQSEPTSSSSDPESHNTDKKASGQNPPQKPLPEARQQSSVEGHTLVTQEPTNVPHRSKPNGDGNAKEPTTTSETKQMAQHPEDDNKKAGSSTERDYSSKSSTARTNSDFVSMLAPGMSSGSQKLRLLLQDDDDVQESSQCSVATPRVLTPQEYAEAIQEVQSKVPESVNSSNTVCQDIPGLRSDKRRD